MKYKAIAALIVLVALIGGLVYELYRLDTSVRALQAQNDSVVTYLNAGIKLGIFPSGDQLSQIAAQKK
jgi:hypothetical protein